MIRWLRGSIQIATRREPTGQLFLVPCSNLKETVLENRITASQLSLSEVAVPKLLRCDNFLKLTVIVLFHWTFGENFNKFIFALQVAVCGKSEDSFH